MKKNIRIALLLLSGALIVVLGAQQAFSQNTEETRTTLKKWTLQMKQMRAQGKTRLHVALDILKEISGDQKSMQSLLLLKAHGATLFYGSSSRNKIHFQKLLISILKFYDLNSLKNYLKLRDDYTLASMFQTISFLFPGDKRFIRAYRKELTKILRWSWQNKKSKRLLTSVLTSINWRFPMGKDGKEMILIPAGEFTYGSPKGYFLGKATLDEFYIDRMEVTNKGYVKFLNFFSDTLTEKGLFFDYRKFLNFEISRISFSDKFTVESKYENHPVTGVSWKGANAYCQVYGKELPTQNQWEKAAKGATHREYPWGDQWDSSKLNFKGGTVPVGTYPQDQSPYGVLDMAGNVSEWTRTKTKRGTYIVLSGSWDSHLSEKNYTTYRSRSWSPNETFSNVGFRCVETRK